MNGKINKEQLSPGLNSELDGCSTQLSDMEKYVVYAEQYNINTNNTDNHDYIINALTDINNHGGGALILPYGIKTSPISFQGFNNITLKGKSTSMPYTTLATLIFIGTNPSGSIGLKFSDDTSGNNRPIWEAKFCKIENMYIDCNNAVDFGINGNLGLHLADVTIKHAKVDGIVLENFTYPAFLYKVSSQNNGRHGIHIKGGMTTCYMLQECEFDYNTGLGLLIEGGARAKFVQCYAQGNAQGGYMINYLAGIPDPYYLENLDIDIYTEANGTLETNDANYLGNYAVIITSYDKTILNAHKPKWLTIRGAINQSSQGKALKIDGVAGCKILPYIIGTIDISTDIGVYGIEFETSPSNAFVSNVGNGKALTSYYNLSAPYGKIVNGLHYANRGNVQIFEFSLASISAGTTQLMDTIFKGIAGLSSGYKMMRTGSIISCGLYKGNTNGTVAGTLSIRPKYVDNSNGLFIAPSFNFASFSDVVLNATDKQMKGNYSIGEYNFNEDYILGLEITSSADYAAGFNSALVGYIVVEW